MLCLLFIEPYRLCLFHQRRLKISTKVRKIAFGNKEHITDRKWEPRFKACSGASCRSLRKHTENFTTKNANFQIKFFAIFHISAQNIYRGYSLEPPRRGGSNEYPQSMILSRNKKNNVYPCKPQFYYIKVGFKGVKIMQACFRDVLQIGAFLES